MATLYYIYIDSTRVVLTCPESPPTIEKRPMPGRGSVGTEGDGYYTVDEACRVLGVKPATLYAYVSRGRLRSYRQGMRRQRLYRRDEVEALARIGPSRP